MTVGILVVAGGSGTRLGAEQPKAFVEVDRRSLLEHTLRAVAEVASVEHVVIAAPASHVDTAAAVLAAVDVPFKTTVVAGGSERQESVAACLRALDASIGVVLVHDAARPFTPAAVFERVIARVRETDAGVVPVVPVVDTLIAVDGERILGAVDRSGVRAVQTPQGFPRRVLERAHAAADGEHVTDDAGLVRRAGHPVVSVDGDDRAFKITTPHDLARAEAMHAQSEFRIGTGTDTHAFDSGRPLWLAGLEWPGEVGLAGHSDADVVCHAIVDALLGAAGLGDIGTVFGTDDPRYDGASGLTFVTGALELLHADGWAVSNVTVQVIGNRPKLAPRRAEAEALLTDAIGASVSLSATTTDGLGFTGRGEGLAAIATALIRRAG